MNGNQSRLLGSLVVLSAVLVACGGPEAAPGDAADLSPVDSAQAALDANAAVDGDATLTTSTPRGMFYCDAPVPLPLDVPAAIFEVEVDRPFHTARPGFVHEWLPVGFASNGTLWSAIMVEFETVDQTRDFDGWLNRDFVIGGTAFWERPSFSLGHSCGIWEVLGEMRPHEARAQVGFRVERFSVGTATRDQLRAWYRMVKAEANRRGYTSLWLLYSQATQEAQLLYFDDVPQAERVITNPVPVAARPPLVPGSTFDQSGWNLFTWFPFVPGDHGRPAYWPMPGIQSGPGDGVCEVARHENWRNTTDCLRTCGNGVEDPGQTVFNCPGDMQLFQ